MSGSLAALARTIDAHSRSSFSGKVFEPRQGFMQMTSFSNAMSHSATPGFGNGTLGVIISGCGCNEEDDGGTPTYGPSSDLGELVGGVAHEFRNILAVIASGLRLIERNSADRRKLGELLTAARGAVEEGVEMVSALLAFARRSEHEWSPQDVNALLSRLGPILKLAAGPGISVLFELAPSVPICAVDRSHFDAAILNLVSNARDSMPSGGRISIGTALIDQTGRPWQAGPGTLRVRVRDEGCGISREVGRRIFEPFFTTKDAKGTGLGLPFVCAFARRAGGDVIVESIAGEGTTVDLLLPVYGNRVDLDPGMCRQLDRWNNEGGADRRDGRDRTDRSAPC